ncbi:tegument protein VP13/14 [Falconid herpesvirus 1]|uniref:Tegument protein UL47 n=1 Tax=Falconid herpesvirus 1 TaxID=1510155 RepID=A0A068EPL4_9ALPH|nr:tegument protein VP13/14 [Falconid herpesvirus 1]AID52753.1 tegument protein VP13/14 [Falconid herpesvirus 1]
MYRRGSSRPLRDYGPGSTSQRDRDRRRSQEPYSQSRRQSRHHHGDADTDEDMEWEGNSGSDSPDRAGPSRGRGGFWDYLRDAFGGASPQRRSAARDNNDDDDSRSADRGEGRSGAGRPSHHDVDMEREDAAPRRRAAPRVASRRPRGRRDSRSTSTGDESDRAGAGRGRHSRVRSRSRSRHSPWRGRAVETDTEYDSEPPQRRRPANLYAPPPALTAEDGSEDLMLSDTDDLQIENKPGIPIKLPPFLERRMLLGDFLSLLPIEPQLEDVSASLSRYEDEVLHKRGNEYGDGALWNDGPKALPEYPQGSMYCTDPKEGQMAAWSRTAKQAHALITALQQRSLLSAVAPAKTSHGTAVLFILDASMRIAASLHNERWSSLLEGELSSPRKAGPAQMFTTVPRDDAYLFIDGPTDHARGPTAAILRSSFGSLAFWPELRVVLTYGIRKCVRYAVAAILRSEVMLATRAGKDQTNMTDAELKTISSSFTAGVVAACVATQFLYTALGRSLHPRAKNDAYERVLDIAPLVRIPMGSDHLTRAESVCFNNIQMDRRVNPSELADAVVAAHVAARSALTDIMLEYAEGYDTDDDMDDRRAIPSPNGDVPSAIIGVALILQRMLGYLNSLASYLIIATLYQGRDVTMWSDTFGLYSFLVSTCTPLYRHMTAGEFYDSRSKAMQELELVAARGDPPMPDRQMMVLEELGELDVLRLISPVSLRNYLGRRVALSEAVDGAREVLFGLEAVEAARQHVTGGRVIGRGRRR